FRSERRHQRLRPATRLQHRRLLLLLPRHRTHADRPRRLTVVGPPRELLLGQLRLALRLAHRNSSWGEASAIAFSVPAAASPPCRAVSVTLAPAPAVVCSVSRDQCPCRRTFAVRQPS